MSDTPPRMTFGVWLQLNPYAKMRGEGIYRLLVFILKAAAAHPGVRIVIACASWTRDDLITLIREHGVPSGHIEILSSRRRVPILLQLAHWLVTRKPKRRRHPRGLSRRMLSYLWHTRTLGWAFRRLLSTDSYLAAALMMLVAAIPVLIVAVVVFVRSAILTIASGLPKWNRTSPFAGKLWQKFTSGLTQLNSEYWTRVRRQATDAAQEQEFASLAVEASKRDDIQVWYVPHPGSLYARQINKPLVVAVPDCVYCEFPTVFDAVVFSKADRAIRDVVSRATRTVSYSDYVRRRHVEQFLGVPSERTRVIHHAPMSVDSFLSETGSGRSKGQTLRERALAIVRDYVSREFKPVRWAPNFPEDLLREYPFEQGNFLFASSQIRPSKNYFFLIKAFERALRRYYTPMKLFVTGPLEHEAWGLKDYIRRQHLELDVISVPDLSPEVHAAFYHLAGLTVVPTLFEGGFPFPFSESLSVGTPAIMSAIPVTTEIIPQDLAKLMLFDPYDVEDMAGRMRWGIAHRQELLARQLPLYESLRQRTWDHVAEEYLALFREALYPDGAGRAGSETPHRGSVLEKVAIGG
jgi:glycosyltransferase involved in cell wall biosynthesis